MNEQPEKNSHEEICDSALEHYDRLSSECNHWFSTVPRAIEFYKKYGEKIGSVSDGYHTFDELYEHRAVLFIQLCLMTHIETLGWSPVWRSKLHSDGSSFDGWFILGIYKEKGKQITYHLPMKKWGETSFAETLERAPRWDGHTPEDVLKRLTEL